YGMLAIVQTGIIFLATLFIGFLLDSLFEFLIIFSVVGVLRKFTGGVHAKTMGGCIAVSLVTITIMAVVSRYILATVFTPLLMLGFMLVGYGVIFLVIYQKAPVDSPNKPIHKPEKITRLRRHSFLFVSIALLFSIILTICSFFIEKDSFVSINCSIMLALVWQTFTLTKTAHIIFGSHLRHHK
ncbi:MAG: accessory regulator AgrB, partial [Oscillospiraceae bacterium]|nr:accessory regulator AgrB [Oscillospiraceae bacterium]